MRVLYSWLKDYVDIKIPPEKLAEVLTMAGLSVESVTKTGGDALLEIEVTSNRPDCLSYIGIAREVAALTGRKLEIPSFAVRLRSGRILNVAEGFVPRLRSGLTIQVIDKKPCPRYTGRIIKEISVSESPAWLKARLEAMGLRAVNNIVDITNFCLFETGEPMHAFDLDKIKGDVVIRRAKDGEKIVTIDGVERKLDNSDLVIADSDKPIAIAGVMGGLNTEVTSSTKSILLEAAHFDSVSVRRTSRRLGISSESSYRFERRIDPENIPYSSDRAAGLILEIAGGDIGRFYDIGKKKENAKTVDLRYSRLNKILGLNIAASKVKNILVSLGLKIKSSSKDNLKLEIPHFRCDLQSEIDLIEEIARIYGYGKIPQTIPVVVEQPMRESLNRIIDNKIREILMGLGLDEIITYGLLSENLLDMSGAANNDRIKIRNPLSSEQEIMRPTLIVGMLNSMRWNLNRKTKNLRLFELGNVYIKRANNIFEERKTLSIGMTGLAHSNWAEGSRPINFFDLKGILEALLSELGVDSFILKKSNIAGLSTSVSATIKVRGESIGILGEIDHKVLANFDIKDKIHALEMNVDAIMEYVVLEKNFKALPRYPSVYRDISIIVNKDVSNEEILSSMKEVGAQILKNIELIDRYAGKQIPDGKIGLTYRFEYRDLQRTLEEKEVSAIHSRIINALETRFGGRLR